MLVPIALRRPLDVPVYLSVLPRPHRLEAIVDLLGDLRCLDLGPRRTQVDLDWNTMVLLGWLWLFLLPYYSYNFPLRLRLLLREYSIDDAGRDDSLIVS